MKEEPDAWWYKQHFKYAGPTELQFTTGFQNSNPKKVAEEGSTGNAEDQYEVEPVLKVKNILPFISEVTENAVNYTNNTIREEVNSSIKNLEAAIQQIQDGETEESVETIMDEVEYLLDRQELWKIHMEDVGDEVAQTLKSMREGEDRGAE